MKHGAGIYKVAKRLKCTPEEILDFSSNINSYTKQTQTQLTTEELVRYGDTTYSTLKKTIAKTYQLKKTHIALYNGATSAIFALINSLKNKRAYLYVPLYGEYEKALKLAQKKIIKIDRAKELYAKPKKNSLILFVNPSTPDGTYYNLSKLFQLWKKQNCTIVVDESFLEFESLPSLRHELQNYDKLYIIQSFTKFYACGGVRVGAIFSQKKNIQKLHQPLWHLSSYDVKFLLERLKDTTFKKAAKKAHRKNKKELLKLLKNSSHFTKVMPSDANFILTQTKDGTKLTDALLKKKILVRRCGSFDTLTDDWLRFGVKNKKMHKKLKDALHHIP